MNQQEKIASLSLWVVGAIVFVGFSLVTMAIFSSQSGNANDLDDQTLVDEREPQVDGVPATPALDCPSAVPCMDKTFVPDVIVFGETSILSVTLVNTDTTDSKAGLTFTDILSPGLELASAPYPDQCFGDVTGIAGTSVFTVAGAWLNDGPKPPNLLSTCEITVTVRPVAPGTYVNDASNIVNIAELDPSLAYAKLKVNPAPLGIEADDKQMWQGSNPPPLTASYGGFVYPDTPPDLDSPVVLTTKADNYSPAGLYPIVAGGASDPNYDISFKPGIMDVYINRMIEKKGMPVYPPGIRR